MKILNHQDILDLNISDATMMKWIRESFLSKKNADLPHKISQTFNDWANFYNTMPCIIPSINGAGVKYVSRYSDRAPSIQWSMLLYNYKTGDSLALMDATWITEKRTGAAAALAVKTFAKKDFQTVAIMGLWNAGKGFLDMFLVEEKNKEKTIKLLKYKDHAETVAEDLKKRWVKDVVICETYEDLFTDSDVIVSAITFTDKVLGKDEWFKKWCLVVPIHTRWFQNCDLFFDKVFADDIPHIANFKYFDKFKSIGELDQVLHWDISGRDNDKQRILSYNIGLALHDVYFGTKIFNLYQQQHAW